MQLSISSVVMVGMALSMDAGRSMFREAVPMGGTVGMEGV